MPTPTLDPATGKFRPSDAGCWYDSHRGFVNIAINIIEDARALGCKECELPEGATQDDFLDGETVNDWEALHEDARIAEEFLDWLAPLPYSVTWLEGEFGMYDLREEYEDDED